MMHVTLTSLKSKLSLTLDKALTKNGTPFAFISGFGVFIPACLNREPSPAIGIIMCNFLIMTYTPNTVVAHLLKELFDVRRYHYVTVALKEISLS